MSEFKQVSVSSTVEHPLMPLNVRSKFKTIHEWLTNICQGKNPNTAIEEFTVTLSLRQNTKEFLVCLYGVNTTLDESNQAYTHIDFEPSSMYFTFSKKQYQEFTYQQMKEELTTSLRSFMKTETFKGSFISKSKIRTSYDGELVWSGE